jgi:uncharacterized protein (TIGR03435 family)
MNRGRFTAKSAPVRTVIGDAYGNFFVHGGPDWVDDLYDFDAEAGSDAGPAQLRVMVQALLMDRFKLAVHRETQEVQVYTLVIGKNGPKMHEGKGTTKPYMRSYGTGPGQRWEFAEVGMVPLVGFLTGTLLTPVLNRTGLKGVYNFKVQFADPRRQLSQNGEQLSADSLPDIFTAVQEQLGLELKKAGKLSMEILVIDHIERPTEN